MSNMSVADILRIYGKWVGGKTFTGFVSEKLHKSERTAYRLITEAASSKEIMRVILPNRAVIYGLAEFGPPSREILGEKDLVRSEFYSKLIQEFWRERAEALEMRKEGVVLGSTVVFDAWDKTERFAELLPDSKKKVQLMERIKKIHNDVYEHGRIFYPRAFAFSNEERVQLLYPKGRMLQDVIPEIWEMIASIIQEL